MSIKAFIWSIITGVAGSIIVIYLGRITDIGAISGAAILVVIVCILVFFCYPYFRVLYFDSNPRLIEGLAYRRPIQKLEARIAKRDKVEKSAKNQQQVHDRKPNFHKHSIIVFSHIYDFWGRLFWGRSTARARALSSFYHATAAWYFYASGNYLYAGRRFHWAAHQFRDIGFLDKAIEFYRNSALSFANAANAIPADTDSPGKKDDRQKSLEQARRSLERAMGICSIVGETESVWNEPGMPAKMKEELQSRLGSTKLDELPKELPAFPLAGLG
jgi:hypothetical protein